MVAVAAVVAANRAKKKKTHMAIEAQLQKDKVAVEENFSELDDKGSGTLTREQTRELLKRVTGIEAVDEDGLIMVFNAITANMEPAEGGGAAFGGDPNLVLPRNQVIDAVSKFRYYLMKKARIDRIFDEFDVNHNGKLEPDELKAFLQSIENKKKREVFGLLVKFTVTDEDVEFILKDCDRSHDGGIDKPEVLAAMAKWEHLAEEHAKDKGSCACLIC